jgi:ABC-type nitrate/sulfonate/bicarbonate transport system permease component
MSRTGQFNKTGWLVFGLFLLIWECGSRSSANLQLYIPPISQIIGALSELIVSGLVTTHLLTTVRRFLEGYLLAAVIAVSAGVALGYFRFAHSLLEMLIEFLRPMPSVAIIPVAILLLGIGDSMIVAVTVYASLWPILVNTIDGVRRIEQTLIDTGRTFGLGRRRMLWQIVLPAASPYIVTGLRISLSIALILVTTAEMVAGSRGLGFFILDEERSLHSSNMYAGIILVAVLGYALNHLFIALERQAVQWHRGMGVRETV